MADSKNDKSKNEKSSSKKKILTVFYVILCLIVVAICGITAYQNYQKQVEKRVAYTQLIKDIQDKKIEKIELTTGSKSIKITYKDENAEGQNTENNGETAQKENNENSEEEKNNLEKEDEKNKKNAVVPDIQAFIEYIQDQVKEGNDIELIQKPKSVLSNLAEDIFSLLPTIVMVILLIMLFKMQGLGDKGQVYDSENLDDDEKVTFDDVAGLDEEKEELIEIVDFLKEPEKYKKMGAKIPKGVLLCGKPGTGKTLIAKAIAGEANVPFISMSGSEFVELFAGLGASRVRKLFEKARKISPCIVFIDEIDAIGARRENAVGADTENNQTLNQLLVEMDGFNSNSSVIVIAATNRPEMLDEAILRPGRFDRRINIALPDVRAREAILKIHAKDKKISKDVDLKSVAEDTAGYSGAELANILNEAAINAAKRKHTSITKEDIDDANKKVTIGLEKKNRYISDKDKKLTAYHEAGHAVVSRYLPTQNFVKEISIIPRGVAGGYTMYKPDEDKYYMSKTEMEEKMVSLFGGRAGEKVALDDISTGASNDIEVAMQIAKEMITIYGMNDKIGPISINTDKNPYDLELLGNDLEDEIGKEVRKLMDNAYERAKQILIAHRDKLDKVAAVLIEKERIDEKEFNEIFSDEDEKI